MTKQGLTFLINSQCHRHLEELADAVLHKQQMSGPLNSGMRSSKPPAYLRSITATSECPLHPHWDAEPDALPWFYLDRAYCSPHRDAGPVFFFFTTQVSKYSILCTDAVTLCQALLARSLFPAKTPLSIFAVYCLYDWSIPSRHTPAMCPKL